jgi:hypothetical protein
VETNRSKKRCNTEEEEEEEEEDDGTGRFCGLLSCVSSDGTAFFGCSIIGLLFFGSFWMTEVVIRKVIPYRKMGICPNRCILALAWVKPVTNTSSEQRKNICHKESENILYL